MSGEEAVLDFNGRRARAGDRLVLTSGKSMRVGKARDTEGEIPFATGLHCYLWLAHDIIVDMLLGGARFVRASDEEHEQWRKHRE